MNECRHKWTAMWGIVDGRAKCIGACCQLCQSTRDATQDELQALEDMNADTAEKLQEINAKLDRINANLDRIAASLASNARRARFIA